MVYTSLAVLALTASSALSPLSHFIHLHRHTAVPDRRINLTLLNRSRNFQDVEIAGHTYTIMPHEQLFLHAPIGTTIIAASPNGGVHMGDIIASLASGIQDQSIVIK